MDGIERYNSSINGKKKLVRVFFIHACSLKHEHRISVSYDFEKNEYEINKEQHWKPEWKEELDQKILKHCEEKVCYYCGDKVAREQLAGFVMSTDTFTKVRYLVDAKCLREKEWINWEDDFKTLDDYLEWEGYKGDEELKDCEDLSGYPRVFEAEPETFFIRPFDIKNQKEITDFDREMVAKFRKEIDLEWEKDPGDVEIIEEGNWGISPEAKLKAKMEQDKCEHQWYNSSASRQRCKKCYVLKN